jgi:hypothetical protein
LDLIWEVKTPSVNSSHKLTPLPKEELMEQIKASKLNLTSHSDLTGWAVSFSKLVMLMRLGSIIN